MKKFSAIQLTMQLAGGKWKCLISYYLIGGQRRTRDLLELLAGISPKVLTEQLRQLESDGLIEQEVFPKRRRVWNTAGAQEAARLSPYSARCANEAKNTTKGTTGWCCNAIWRICRLPRPSRIRVRKVAEQ